MGLGFLQVYTVRSSDEFQMCLCRPLRSSPLLGDGPSQDSGKLEAEILDRNPPHPHLSEEEFSIMLSLAQRPGLSNIYKYSLKQKYSEC